MADPRDRPPILRALLLLVALVGTALTLAALSPSTDTQSVASSPAKDTAAARGTVSTP